MANDCSSRETDQFVIILYLVYTNFPHLLFITLKLKAPLVLGDW